MLIEIWQQHQLNIRNGFFEHKDIHKYTWVQQSLQIKAIIDFVSKQHIRRKYAYDIFRIHRKAECYTDHYLVRAKICFFLCMNFRGHKTGHATTRQMRIISFNFVQSLNNDSTVFVCKFKHNLKLGNITHLNGLNLTTVQMNGHKKSVRELPENNNKYKYQGWNEEIRNGVIQKQKP